MIRRSTKKPEGYRRSYYPKVVDKAVQQNTVFAAIVEEHYEPALA
jgi:hypothetical protein